MSHEAFSMTPSEQTAQSRKYAATQFCFVPVPAGMAVFNSYGSRRELIGVLPDAESLWKFLAEQFDPNHRDATPVAQATQEHLPLFEPEPIHLDELTLDDLNLDDLL